MRINIKQLVKQAINKNYDEIVMIGGAYQMGVGYTQVNKKVMPNFSGVVLCQDWLYPTIWIEFRDGKMINKAKENCDEDYPNGFSVYFKTDIDICGEQSIIAIEAVPVCEPLYRMDRRFPRPFFYNEQIEYSTFRLELKRVAPIYLSMFISYSFRIFSTHLHSPMLMPSIHKYLYEDYKNELNPYNRKIINDYFNFIKSKGFDGYPCKELPIGELPINDRGARAFIYEDDRNNIYIKNEQEARDATYAPLVKRFITEKELEEYF